MLGHMVNVTPDSNRCCCNWSAGQAAACAAAVLLVAITAMVANILAKHYLGASAYLLTAAGALGIAAFVTLIIASVTAYCSKRPPDATHWGAGHAAGCAAAILAVAITAFVVTFLTQKYPHISSHLRTATAVLGLAAFVTTLIAAVTAYRSARAPAAARV